MMTTKFFSGSATGDVFEGVAVDEQQVGERAFFDDAELAGVGVAFAGEREQLGVGAGGHREDFGGGVPAGERREQGALALGER